MGMALALMKNYDPFKSPTHFKLTDLMKKFDKTFGASGKDYGKVTGERTMEDIEKRRTDRWNFLFIAGMWFQDLFNYDFRRTERCIIPYATQEGEISFCAYNTGVGWRNIIEKMHMTATLTKWYDERGRHEIFAGGKKVALDTTEHTLKLDAEAVAKGKQTDLDEKGIAKNAREEKLRARKAETENKRMAELYRQVVLKEPKPEIATGLQIQGLGKKKTETRRRSRTSRVLTFRGRMEHHGPGGGTHPARGVSGPHDFGSPRLHQVSSFLYWACGRPSRASIPSMAAIARSVIRCVTILGPCAATTMAALGTFLGSSASGLIVWASWRSAEEN